MTNVLVIEDLTSAVLQIGLADSEPVTITTGYGALVIEGIGAPGINGAQGEPGVGVPAGGTTGQFLQKGDKGDYDTLWADVVAGVNSVSNGDGTLTISPTSGDVGASLNLANANIWTARQTFANNISFGGAPLAVSGLVNGDNLQYNGTNWVNRKSYYSQIQFGRVQFNSVGIFQMLTSAVTFSPTFAGTPFVFTCFDDSSNYLTSAYTVSTFVRNRSASGCTVGLMSPNTGGTAPNYGVMWMAIL